MCAQDLGQARRHDQSLAEGSPCPVPVGLLCATEGSLYPWDTHCVPAGAAVAWLEVPIRRAGRFCSVATTASRDGGDLWERDRGGPVTLNKAAVTSTLPWPVFTAARCCGGADPLLCGLARPAGPFPGPFFPQPFPGPIPSPFFPRPFPGPIPELFPSPFYPRPFPGPIPRPFPFPGPVVVGHVCRGLHEPRT